MTEQDELVVLQRAKEKFPNATPRIISDNGAQFVAKDFKEFIRICGMTHVRTSPNYPQSNGKLERFHGSIKGECIRPGTPISLEDAIRIVTRYVEHYNQVRLHSAITIPDYLRAQFPCSFAPATARDLCAQCPGPVNRRREATAAGAAPP